MLDRLPGEELKRLVAAANRARGLDTQLMRAAMYANEEQFAKLRAALDGSSAAPTQTAAPPEDEDHSAFLSQVREHFAKGKS